MKGLEDVVLCRDSEDYDQFVKIIFLTALSKKVIVVIYAVLSNHFHAVVLALCQDDAYAFGEEVKRRYSIWLNRKYGLHNVMQGARTGALAMTDRMHIRNALAYVPRNSLDNGQNVNSYKWSGYRGMFCRGEAKGGRPVSALSRREMRSIFHTATLLDNLRWRLNDDNELEPSSCCDHDYLEQAFENDQAYFMRTIGSLNIAEQRYMLEDKLFNVLPDTEFFDDINRISFEWFGEGLDKITLAKKYRLMLFIFRTRKTSVPQLARVLSLDRETVKAVLRIK